MNHPNFIANLGTAPGDASAMQLVGILIPPPDAIQIASFDEDNGSISVSSVVRLVEGSQIRTTGTIGDGPYGGQGTSSGDFDFYQVEARAGQTLLIDIDTPQPTAGLDSIVGIYASNGVLLAYNDDDLSGGTYDSYIEFNVPEDGLYYVAVGGFIQVPVSPDSFPLNPFDSSSGPGVGSEGTYALIVGLNVPMDFDYFSFDLQAGDILGINGLESVRMIKLLDAAGNSLITSSKDTAGAYPETSPLPAGGNTSLAYVASRDGRFIISAEKGAGQYKIEVNVYRPLLSQQDGEAIQTIFLDFDGATINPSIFSGPDEERTLSPFRTFLPRWGLTAADENAVLDAILKVVHENLAHDVSGSTGKGRNGDFLITGIPGEFAIQILNSRDHTDPVGHQHVSRVIIGGTTEQAGINTIGVSESIDVGNFDTSESALVLLDLLSGGTNDPNSLNRFGLAGSLSKIDLVGIGVGNIVAHEAGHFFGNWHTNNSSSTPANIMDRGGDLSNIVGIGPDNIFGSADDQDVDFGIDQYTPEEDLVGLQDTLQTIAFGLSTSALPPQLDLQQSVTPTVITPGDSLTFTISYSNIGSAIATGVVISNIFPSLITELSYVSQGAKLETIGSKPYVWQAENLASRQGGIIQVTGIVSPDLVDEETIISNALLHANHLDVSGSSSVSTEYEINLPPSVDIGGPYRVFRDTPVHLAASATDPGNDELFFRWDFDGDGNFDDGEGLKPLFNPSDFGELEVVEITVRVNDSDGAYDTATTAIVIVDREAIANPGGPYHVNEGDVVTLDQTFVSAAFGNAVQYEWDFDGDGVFDDATGKTPIFDARQQDGPATVTIAMRLLLPENEQPWVGTTSVMIQNVMPIARGGGPYSVDEGGTVMLTGSGEDASSLDSLEYAWDLNGDRLFDDGAEAELLFDAAGLDGPQTLDAMLRVMDDDGGFMTSTIQINIQNVKPVAVDDVAKPYMNRATNIDVLKNDIDAGGDTLTIQAVGTPNNGVATTDGITVVYTPTAEFIGSDELEYTIMDKDGASDSAVVTIRVEPQPAAIHVTDDVVTGTQDTTLTIDVLANDHGADEETLLIREVGEALNGNATTDGSIIVYTPRSGFSGRDQFSYLATNSIGLTDSGLVAVEVRKGGTVSGTIFLDENENERFDEGEEGIANATITLTAIERFASFGNPDDRLSFQTKTNSRGFFYFDFVLPGSYDISMEPLVLNRNAPIGSVIESRGQIDVPQRLPLSNKQLKFFLPLMQR
ncbi:cadherin-like domain-containing protein [Chloroflexi bacterium TSY]|nr:cadherin-like domain-containing protein [Chloroflexi bacterium TSY]